MMVEKASVSQPPYLKEIQQKSREPHLSEGERGGQRPKSHRSPRDRGRDSMSNPDRLWRPIRKWNWYRGIYSQP